MTKPLNQQQWLARYAPGAKDRHIESAWLDEHYLYGGQVHQVAGEAIAQALGVASSREVGHALYLKLFAEYANALEVAGAWGWVLRTRRRHNLLMDAFLTYPHDAPREFYAAAKRSRGSASRLLDLPAEVRVIDALEHAFPEWTVDERRGTLRLCVGQAKRLAEDYLALDGVVRRIYNRTKHGATLYHDASQPAREFHLVAPHLALSEPNDQRRYELATFTVNRKSVEGTLRDLTDSAALIKFLAGLAKGMNDAGCLYPPRHPLVRGRVPARLRPSDDKT